MLPPQRFRSTAQANVARYGAVTGVQGRNLGLLRTIGQPQWRAYKRITSQNKRAVRQLNKRPGLSKSDLAKRWGPGPNPFDPQQTIERMMPSSNITKENLIHILEGLKLQVEKDAHHILDEKHPNFNPTADQTTVDRTIANQTRAIDAHIAQLHMAGADGEAEKTYQKQWISWLLGYGNEKEVAVTPWGRKMLEIPAVVEFVRLFPQKRGQFVEKLTELKLMGPRTLEEAALYYKYFVYNINSPEWRNKHGLMDATDDALRAWLNTPGNIDKVVEDDFLKDWEVFFPTNALATTKEDIKAQGRQWYGKAYDKDMSYYGVSKYGSESVGENLVPLNGHVWAHDTDWYSDEPFGYDWEEWYKDEDDDGDLQEDGGDDGYESVVEGTPQGDFMDEDGNIVDVSTPIQRQTRRGTGATQMDVDVVPRTPDDDDEGTSGGGGGTQGIGQQYGSNISVSTPQQTQQPSQTGATGTQAPTSMQQVQQTQQATQMVVDQVTNNNNRRGGAGGGGGGGAGGTRRSSRLADKRRLEQAGLAGRYQPYGSNYFYYRSPGVSSIDDYGVSYPRSRGAIMRPSLVPAAGQKPQEIKILETAERKVEPLARKAKRAKVKHMPLPSIQPPVAQPTQAQPVTVNVQNVIPNNIHQTPVDPLQNPQGQPTVPTAQILGQPHPDENKSLKKVMKAQNETFQAILKNMIKVKRLLREGKTSEAKVLADNVTIQKQQLHNTDALAQQKLTQDAHASKVNEGVHKEMQALMERIVTLNAELSTAKEKQKTAALEAANAPEIITLRGEHSAQKTKIQELEARLYEVKAKRQKIKATPTVVATQPAPASSTQEADTLKQEIQTLKGELTQKKTSKKAAKARIAELTEELTKSKLAEVPNVQVKQQLADLQEAYKKLETERDKMHSDHTEHLKQIKLKKAAKRATSKLENDERINKIASEYDAKYKHHIALEAEGRKTFEANLGGIYEKALKEVAERKAQFFEERAKLTSGDQATINKMVEEKSSEIGRLTQEITEMKIKGVKSEQEVTELKNKLALAAKQEEEIVQLKHQLQSAGAQGQAAINLLGMLRSMHAMDKTHAKINNYDLSLLPESRRESVKKLAEVIKADNPELATIFTEQMVLQHLLTTHEHHDVVTAAADRAKALSEATQTIEDLKAKLKNLTDSEKMQVDQFNEDLKANMNNLYISKAKLREWFGKITNLTDLASAEAWKKEGGDLTADLEKIWNLAYAKGKTLQTSENETLHKKEIGDLQEKLTKLSRAYVLQKNRRGEMKEILSYIEDEAEQYRSKFKHSHANNKKLRHQLSHLAKQLQLNQTAQEVNEQQIQTNEAMKTMISAGIEEQVKKGIKRKEVPLEEAPTEPIVEQPAKKVRSTAATPVGRNVSAIETLNNMRAVQGVLEQQIANAQQSNVEMEKQNEQGIADLSSAVADEHAAVQQNYAPATTVQPTSEQAQVDIEGESQDLEEDPAIQEEFTRLRQIIGSSDDKLVVRTAKDQLLMLQIQLMASRMEPPGEASSERSEVNQILEQTRKTSAEKTAEEVKREEEQFGEHFARQRREVEANLRAITKSRWKQRLSKLKRIPVPKRAATAPRKMRVHEQRTRAKYGKLERMAEDVPAESTSTGSSGQEDDKQTANTLSNAYDRIVKKESGVKVERKVMGLNKGSGIEVAPKDKGQGVAWITQNMINEANAMRRKLQMTQSEFEETLENYPPLLYGIVRSS